jgi:L-serine kinase (ATP) / ParB family transcriptional regulator, heme-responsive regulator
MTTIRDLPLLAILPLDKFLLHERHDQQRSPLLLENIRASGVLRNPPIVSPLHDRTGRYMVLDGAHRTLSFQMLGLRHILAQVVEHDDPGLSLYPWNHVVWGLDPEELLASLMSIPFMRLEACHFEAGLQLMSSKHALTLVQLPGEKTYAAFPPAHDLAIRVKYLNAIVDRYRELAHLDRTNLKDIRTLGELYPQLTGLIILPGFRIEEVLYLAGAGHLLPTGSTRFTISPRALHVNYPLIELENSKSLEDKNMHLHQWLQERLANKNVRHYLESTFLFDE